MKMLVAGVQRMFGTAKVSGNAYDMCAIVALVPVENRAGAKMTLAGFGYKAMELPCEVAVLPQFKDVAFPCMLELSVEPRPRNGKLESVVVGVLADKPKA